MVERLNKGSDEVDWSPEAQAAREALGIVINRPARGERVRIRKAREQMVEKLAQAIAKARERDYPLATGEAMRESIDI